MPACPLLLTLTRTLSDYTHATRMHILAHLHFLPGKAEPPGLTKRTRHLWRSFCVADRNSSGLVSKPELFEVPRLHPRLT